MITRVWPLLCGALFAFGLVLSGMTQPAKITGFLDFAGAWDPSLAFVMGGAVGVYFVANRLVRRRRKPLFGDGFPPLPATRVDARLLAGALLFGVGWGLGGFCPGPALVSGGAGATAALWFVPAMLAGMLLHQLFARRSTSTGDG
jgi:uncharacterized membrane protein YedE/YeeE